VDEPQRAVQEADSLVSSLLDRLTAMLADERRGVAEQEGGTASASTEELRLSLQRYRAIFERLTAI
jgi:hypothetical protein